jgi:UDP-N-acetylmuramoylalanine--D-glutamate ligase
MELAGRNALVLGLGVSGLSMARWLSHRGACVRVADTRQQPPCGAQLEREMPGTLVETGALGNQTTR